MKRVRTENDKLIVQQMAPNDWDRMIKKIVGEAVEDAIAEQFVNSGIPEDLGQRQRLFIFLIDLKKWFWPAIFYLIMQGAVVFTNYYTIHISPKTEKQGP